MLKDDGLRVKASEIPGAGKGLFYMGSDPVKKGARVTYYGAPRAQAANDPNSDYVYDLGPGRVLDAAKPLNPVGRYINGTRGGLRPNVQVNQRAQIQRKWNRSVVPVMAIKTIQPNTELLLSYGAQYWRSR
jgi:hypothetical protein